MRDDDVLARLRRPNRPRTNRYDPAWILRNADEGRPDVSRDVADGP